MPLYSHKTNYFQQGCRPSYRRSKTTKQIQSVAKQFGSIGKKLKKNLGQLSKGALTRKGSFRGDQRGTKYTDGYIQVIKDSDLTTIHSYISLVDQFRICKYFHFLLFRWLGNS